MPVNCSINIDRLSTEDFRAFDYTVMGHMFASQNEIGRLADEQVYRSDVAKRLDAAGMQSDQEISVNVAYMTFAKTLSLDLVVSKKALYELKAVATLNSNHVSQLLTYLYLLDLPRGKLVNFRSTSVESRFVNAPIPRVERCGFSVSEHSFQGDRNLLELAVGLVRDWGTSLSVSLYHQALVHLLGGKESVQRMLPLTRDGQHLANQRFHLVDEHTAFELTAFAKLDIKFTEQLHRLLMLSPLQRLHWINIGSHSINFHTIDRT